ncbi:ATP-binding protein [Acidihalobacter yilgarnensis]
METHKGTILAENRADGGLCMTLSLPAMLPALPAPKQMNA